MGIENHEVLGTVYTGELERRIREAQLEAVKRQREHLTRTDLTFPLNIRAVVDLVKQAKDDAIAKWRADGEPE